MNQEEEFRFAEWTKQTQESKVEFGCSYGTLDGGEVIPLWHFSFDGDVFVDDSGGNISLIEGIKDYFIWSSQRIKELEAKLALAHLFSDSDKTV
ncbi:hypothetical protein QUA13_29100 [Microcoleus sp. S28C3]|uniref:hypothetical protein n=1 Tax=Microcoleus sp. S28C3 TaxID=3055414 RepID=UPI002FD574EA